MAACALLVAGGSTANSQPPTPEESPLAGDVGHISTKERIARRIAAGLEGNSEAVRRSQKALSAGSRSAQLIHPPQVGRHFFSQWLILSGDRRCRDDLGFPPRERVWMN
jgi:hypothetical protein